MAAPLASLSVRWGVAAQSLCWGHWNLILCPASPHSGCAGCVPPLPHQTEAVGLAASGVGTVCEHTLDVSGDLAQDSQGIF